MYSTAGFVGREEATPILLNGFFRLEYRGHGSAGITIYDKRGGLQVIETKGRLQVFQDLIQGGRMVHGTLGPEHTHWAIHGKPSGISPYPQVSESSRFAVMYDDIIENYMELQRLPQSKRITFVSQTDIKTTAQLLRHYCDGDILGAAVKILNRIQGVYALGTVCADCPGWLIAARKDSPLILDYGEKVHYLVFDTTTLIKYTREVCCLDDGEIIEPTVGYLWVYNVYLRPAEKKRCHVDWETSAAKKGGCEHSMVREIMEQPEAFCRTVFPRIQEGWVVLDELDLEPDCLRGLNKLYVIACDSSRHVGMAARYTLERLLRKPVGVTLVSGFRYCDPTVTDKIPVLIIDQPGETVDTLAALREAKRLGARMPSTVNMVGFMIVRESDDVLYTWAGPETAVVTTKAFSTQFAVVYLIGLYCIETLGTLDEAEYDCITSELLLIPIKLEQILGNRADVQYLASLYLNHSSTFFIGRNTDYVIDMEGSLELKEISYVHPEVCATGELKRGTISLIESDALVVVPANYVELLDKIMSNVMEVKSQGVDALGLTMDARAVDTVKTMDHVIPVPDIHPLLLLSLGVASMQLFVYYVVSQRGCDIDRPRNLAKSVAVEWGGTGWKGSLLCS